MEHNPLLINELYYALSDQDLQKIYPGSFYIYNDLDRVDDINDLFINNDVCYILIETNKTNNGHYFCLIKRGMMIEQFDSYGLPIEEQKAFVKPQLLDKNNHITRLLLNSPYKVSYNEHEFQDYSDNDIATCGRWCCLRGMYKDLPLSKFKDMVVRECVRLNVMPDDLSVLMTEKYLES
jgi:hypothetical protein